MAPAYRIESYGGFGAPQSNRNAGNNPPAGVAIPFWVKNAPDSVKAYVTVLDSAHKLLTTDSSTAKNSKLKVETGMNQYVWNFEYPEGEKALEGLIIWNSARMAPLAVRVML